MAMVDQAAQMQQGSPGFQKAADQATQALGQMLKFCHQANPDSPLCDVLGQMIKAVGDIEANYAQPGGNLGADTAAEASSEGEPMGAPEGVAEPPAELAAEGETPPSGGSGTEFVGPGGPFAQASADTQAMMQAAAKKRQP
jgi:hypothetical protein